MSLGLITILIADLIASLVTSWLAESIACVAQLAAVCPSLGQRGEEQADQAVNHEIDQVVTAGIELVEVVV